MEKRVLDKRDNFNISYPYYIKENNIAANYYPVTSFI